MPPTGRPNESRIDPIEVRDEHVVIQRALELKAPNVIVTYRIRAANETPVEFQVVDPFPASLDVEEAGFDPNNEPLHGRIDDQSATISGVVEPGEERVVRYGLRQARSSEPADIERRQQSARPSVAIASPVNRGGDAAADLEKATMTRSASRSGSTDADSVDTDSTAEEASAREDAPAESTATGGSDAEPTPVAGSSGDDAPNPSDERDESTDDDQLIYPGRSGTTADDADRTDRTAEPSAAEPEASGSDDSRGEPESARAEASTADVEPAESASSPADRRESSAEPTADRDAGRADRPSEGVFGVDEGTPPEDEPAPAERSTATEPPDVAPPEGDVVEALLEGLEQEYLSPDQRRRLAEQLDDVLAVTGRPSKSTELRLQELESRVQAMTTYAEALEGIIDEFGPADEFLAEVRREVEGLDTAVEQVQDDLEQAATARASLGDRLDNFDDELALMESRLERMDDRVEALRTVQHRKVSTLEAKVEELGDLADRVADLEPELASLREAVQEGRARRRAIARALSEDEPPTE